MDAAEGRSRKNYLNENRFFYASYIYLHEVYLKAFYYMPIKKFWTH